MNRRPHFAKKLTRAQKDVWKHMLQVRQDGEGRTVEEAEARLRGEGRDG